MSLATTWNLSGETMDEIMRVGSPLHEVQQQRLAQIREILATGVPITLTSNGKKLCTFYPDGTTEHHDWGI